MTKHIFITGGVVSSLGKGLTSASLGMLLEARGLAIRMQKLDPYLNIDPGLMSPFQHGEVYVLGDGTEADLDLGHYERFTNSPLTKNSSLTAGKIYRNVLRRERKGKYHGKTIQVIPHITNEIKRAIRSLRGDDVDVVLTEIGGTVGDIESLPFLEAIRQFALDVGRENCLFLHLTLIPFLKSSGELKTKPTQHSVGRLRQIGIQPDILICRTEHSISDAERNKIALFCNLESRNVIEEKDAEFSIYEVPIVLQKHGLDQRVVDFFWKENNSPPVEGWHFAQQNDGVVPDAPMTTPPLRGTPPKEGNRADLTAWNEMLDRLRHPQHEVTIAVVGKYAKHKDAYKSIYEALTHAGIKHRTKVRIVRISSGQSFDTTKLEDVDGILVSDGLGDEVADGKIEAIRFAREREIPFFGIDLGVQSAVIEFAQSVVGCNRKEPLMHAGLQRGTQPSALDDVSKTFVCYGSPSISERHRSRCKFNDEHRERFQNAGLLFAGASPDGKFVDVIELPSHPWFVAVQFHPEFKSQPTNPHPLFAGFVEAAVKHRSGGA